MRLFCGLTAVAALLAGPAFAAETYTLDGENTTITFVGAKKDGTHAGGFKKLNGKASVEAGDPTTLKLEAVIDMNSMYTDAEKLTAHLKAPDFFEVKRYPKSTFKVTKVAKAEKDYKVTGELTMHGETKPIEFPAQIKATDGELTLTSSFKIDRTKWGISYGSGNIDDEVALTVQVKAPRAKETAAK